jgi:hypothetical protein
MMSQNSSVSPRRYGGPVVAIVVALLAAGWFLGRPALERRHDVAALRSAYRAFPMYPGATKTGERSFEITADGVGTGDYGLTVTYRLPAMATAPEVIDFFRRRIPAGWREATDETCAGLASLAPPPVATSAPGITAPPTTAFSGRFVLSQKDSELTVFAPGTERVHGVTFRVRGTVLTLDDASYGCEPG